MRTTHTGPSTNPSHFDLAITYGLQATFESLKRTMEGKLKRAPSKPSSSVEGIDKRIAVSALCSDGLSWRG